MKTAMASTKQPNHIGVRSFGRAAKNSSGSRPRTKKLPKKLVSNASARWRFIASSLSSPKRGLCTRPPSRWLKFDTCSTMRIGHDCDASETSWRAIAGRAVDSLAPGSPCDASAWPLT